MMLDGVTNKTIIQILLTLVVLAITFHGPGRPDDADEFAAYDETNQPRRPTIFVSVASYRDDECSATIADLFKKATFPHRVFVGVCEQNSTDARESCRGDHDPQFDKQIKTITLKHTDAAGPCVARYHCSTLYGGEDYFMQIDSHTKFADGWDQLCIDEIAKCDDPSRSILSVYPVDDEKYGTAATDTPVMCNAKFNDHGIPTFTAGMKPGAFHNGTPKVNAFIAGGFFFAPGSFVRIVPYDPSLRHLFQGEEILLSARAWTHGFDIYSPSTNVVSHHYIREEKPKFWNDIDKSTHEHEKHQSESRARRLLGLEEPVIHDDRYGMGHVRTLVEYWSHAGIDPVTGNVTGNFCH